MDYLSWQSAFVETMRQLLDRAAAFVPNLLGALVLLLLGWIVARLVRLSIERLARLSVSRISKAEALGRAFERTRLKGAIPSVTGAIVYWIILLFFAAAAIERLDLAIASDLVSKLTFYLPNVLLGLLLILAGIVAGNVARGAVIRAASTARIGQAVLLGRMAELTLILIGIVVGIDQIGVQSTLLTIVLAVSISSVMVAGALAFGLGARVAVSNIIASHYVARFYEVGQLVRVAGVEGRILEFNQTGVILDSTDGRVLVPARKFSEEASLLLAGEN